MKMTSNILTKLSLTQDQLNVIISEKQLYPFSKAAEHSRLSEFGVKLGLSSNQIYCVITQSNNYPSVKCLFMLIKWQQMKSKYATLHRLLEVFDKCIEEEHTIDIQQIQNGIGKMFNY